MRKNLLWLLLSMFSMAASNLPLPNGNGEPPMPLNKFDDPAIAHIYDLADRRLGDSLLPYLSGQDAKLRREAALVMGSVADSAAAPALLPLLADNDPVTAQAAAWALGQIGDTTLAPALRKAIGSTSGQTQTVVGEALGKCATKADLEAALAQYAQLPSVSHNCIAQMLYRAGLRKVIPAGGADHALRILEAAQSPEAQHYAAAYLGRVKDLGPLTNPERIVSLLRKSKDDELKQLLVKSLRRCYTPACTECLSSIIGDNRESATARVNAIIAASDTHDIHAAAIVALKVGEGQVAVAAAEWLRDHGKPEKANFLQIARHLSAWRPRAILLVPAYADAIARTSGIDQMACLQVIDSLMAMANPYEKGALMKAKAVDPGQHQWLMDQALAKQPIVSTDATEALISQQIHSPVADSINWGTTLAKLIGMGDQGITAMCAEHIADDSPGSLIARRQLRVGQLDSALKRLTLPQDIETYNALEKAIAKLQGIAPVLTKLNTAKRLDWETIRNIPTGQMATITTTKGRFRWRFNVEAAPGTVANIMHLIKEGYYNGKYFHRVVPAFVAQGGCPRGDGWGSTPETIRSEWADLSYAAGTVGMASAGKDTESCQWFITHCETPHLDGRYTIFAQVTEGMGVVQQLEVGDKIIRIDLD